MSRRTLLESLLNLSETPTPAPIQLEAPTIAVLDDMLFILPVAHAQAYDIYDNGILVGSTDDEEE